jgi:hypothetical protein
MSKIGRHIFEIQEKENNILVHNEQEISEEEQHQIDEHEAQEHNRIDYMTDLIAKQVHYHNR